MYRVLGRKLGKRSRGSGTALKAEVTFGLDLDGKMAFVRVGEGERGMSEKTSVSVLSGLRKWRGTACDKTALGSGQADTSPHPPV